MLRLIQNQLFESICARNICLRSAHGYTRHTVFVVVIVVSSTHIQSGSGCNREPSRWEGVLVMVVMMMMMMMMVVVVVIWRQGSKPAITDHILGTNLPPFCIVFLVWLTRDLSTNKKVNILIADVYQNMLLMICTFGCFNIINKDIPAVHHCTHRDIKIVLRSTFPWWWYYPPRNLTPSDNMSDPGNVLTSGAATVKIQAGVRSKVGVGDNIV